MNVSEMIAKLEALKAEHGDLPVVIWDEVHGWKAPELERDEIPHDYDQGERTEYVPAITVHSF